MADDVHGKPAEGMECLAMFEPIDETNYVEYQAAPSGKWRPCLYGAEMIEGLRTSQYKNYMERIQKSDCKAEMKRLMESGPPVWVTDKHACPLEEGETHVCKLWFMSDNREVSAMLEGACDGEERQKLWDELKSVHAVVEEVEGEAVALHVPGEEGLRGHEVHAELPRRQGGLRLRRAAHAPAERHAARREGHS